MTDTSSSPSTKTISASNSREFGSNIPADAPEWARVLAEYNHSRFDKIENGIENLSELVGRVMGFTMQTKQVCEGTKELAEVTAARLQAFTRSVDVKADDIAKIRKEVRSLRRDGAFERASMPGEAITTDQRNAISREEAEKIAREADERRERERELKDLRAEVARMNAQISTDAQAREKTRERLLDKLLLPIVTGVVVAIVSVYATYRITRPAVQIEYKEVPHAK